MRRFSWVILCLCAAFVAESAEAKRAGVSWAEELIFVEKANSGGDRSLCILAKRFVLFDVVSIWRTPASYAIAAGRCEGDDFYALSDVGFANEQANGVFSSGLPAKPQLGLKRTLEGAWGSAAVLMLLVGAFILKGLRRGAAKRGGGASLPSTPLASRTGPAPEERDRALAIAQDRAFEVICRAAALEKAPSGEAIAGILDLAQEMTGRRYTPEQAAAALTACDRRPNARWFRDLGAGLEDRQKAGLVRAAWLQLSSQGELNGASLEFLGKLAAAFGLGPEDVRRIASSA